jgi:hypothetical protein
MADAEEQSPVGEEAQRGLAAPRTLAVALLFGVFALLIVVAGLTLPIAGTRVVTDPREIFTMLGAALTGPLGGAIIGALAALREPEGMQLPSLLAHVPACVWVGWAYKRLVYERFGMPALLGAWFVLVLSAYALFLVPGFVIGARLFRPEAYVGAYGEGTAVLTAYLQLVRLAAPEALITAALTTLVLVAIPRRRRRPLW